MDGAHIRGGGHLGMGRAAPDDRKVLEVLLRAARGKPPHGGAALATATSSPARSVAGRSTAADTVVHEDLGGVSSIVSAHTSVLGGAGDGQVADAHPLHDDAPDAPGGAEATDAEIHAAHTLRTRPNLADRMFRNWHNAHGRAASTHAGHVEGHGHGGYSAYPPSRVMVDNTTVGATLLAYRGREERVPQRQHQHQHQHAGARTSFLAELREGVRSPPAQQVQQPTAVSPQSVIATADPLSPAPIATAQHFPQSSVARARAREGERGVLRGDGHEGGGAAAAHVVLCCHVCLAAAARARVPACGHAVCAACLSECAVTEADVVASTSARGERVRSSTPGPTHRCRTCGDGFHVDDLPPPMAAAAGRRGASTATSHPRTPERCRMRACLDADATLGGENESAVAADADADAGCDVSPWHHPSPPACDRCERFASAVMCVNCRASFCEACHRTVHVGALKAHVVQPQNIAYLTDVNARMISEGVCPVRGHGNAALEYFDTVEGYFMCEVCRVTRCGDAVDGGGGLDPRCVRVADAAARAEAELRYVEECGSGFIDHLRGSIQNLQGSVKEVTRNKEECKNLMRETFAGWRAELDAEEASWERRLDDFYNTQRETVDRELGRQVAFLGTFLRSMTKVLRAAEATKAQNPRKTIAARQVTHLTELMELVKAPLHQPPLSRLSVLVHQDVEWVNHITSRMDEYCPGSTERYAHASSVPVPRQWEEASSDASGGDNTSLVDGGGGATAGDAPG